MFFEKEKIKIKICCLSTFCVHLSSASRGGGVTLFNTCSIFTAHPRVEPTTIIVSHHQAPVIYIIYLFFSFWTLVGHSMNL
jgi:hypothetical protein